MSSRSNPDQTPTIRQQVHALERQLLALRRQLDVDFEPLPQGPFSALEVRVGGSWYLVPIAPIEEVLPMVWPHPLPEAPPWVLGCIDVGGRVLPLIDLQRRLDEVGAAGVQPDHAMILVNQPRVCAFAVEGLGEVVRVEPGDVIAPPSGIPQAPFLRGALTRPGEAIRFLLCVNRLSHEFILDGARCDVP